jgi:hypothetical protein
MARLRFVIAKYRVHVSPGSTSSGGRVIFDRWISCNTIRGALAKKETCSIYFLTPDSQTKDHSIRELTGGRLKVVLYFPESAYKTVIDLLRVGQRPIEVNIDSNRPELAKISTSSENVKYFKRESLIP